MLLRTHETPLNSLQHSAVQVRVCAGRGAECQGVGRLLCIQKYFALLETYFTSNNTTGELYTPFCVKQVS